MSTARPSRLSVVDIVNLFGDEWDLEEEHEGFKFRDAWVGARLGAELIGGSMYEVASGRKLWPYHLHHSNEEWLIVLRGRPTLRTPEGERELREGDVACFLRGAAGAHQVRNDTEELVRVLMLSTMLTPEILEYPDSDKVAARDANGGRLFLTRQGEPAEYWDGEA
jgi:uncharacterized cupin superfamily protein